jgi:hypothetical protein
MASPADPTRFGYGWMVREVHARRSVRKIGPPWRLLKMMCGRSAAGTAESVAARHRVPVVLADPFLEQGGAWPAPAAVVLQAAAHVVGLTQVVRDVIELRQLHVVDDLPRGGAVVADLVSAVAAVQDPLGVERVDP